MIIEGHLLVALTTATGCNPDAIKALELPAGNYDLKEVVMKAVADLCPQTPILWTADDFKNKYYDDKWKKHGMTSFQPQRFPQFWEATYASNWVLLGDKPDAALAVVKGRINPPKSLKRFSVKSIVEIPLNPADIRPDTAPSAPSATPIPETLFNGSSGAENGGKPMIDGIENGSEERRLAPDAVSYVAWALWCIRQKEYGDAQAHIITALKRSGYYKEG